MSKSYLLLGGLILGSLLSVNVNAKLFKWVDDNGTTHYGETIPPKYANRNVSELNKQGRVQRRIVVLTPEEKRAQRAALAKKKAQDKIDIQTKRRDKALLSTFSNENEIDLARDRGLKQVNARINSVNSMIGSAKAALAGLKNEQNGLSKQSKAIPKSLLDDIADKQSRIARLQRDLRQNEIESAKVTARFNADKLRYRELKGGAPSKSE